jgi:hypothetical protein
MLEFDMSCFQLNQLAPGPRRPGYRERLLGLALFYSLIVVRAAAQGIPEPALVMYGAIHVGSIRMSVGTLTWQFQSPLRTVTLTTAITNINDQFSYVLQVPCETEIGTFAASSNKLALISVPRTYNRALVTITTDKGSYATASLVNRAQTNLVISTLDRGGLERVDLIVTASLADSDGNGIPDYWELYYFGHVGIDPNDDPDQDGMTNLQEYLAGTNPLDPSSRFAFINITRADSGIRVDWASAENYFYVLQRSGNLLGGFTNIAVHIPGKASTTSWQDTTAVGPGPYFYRLRIE